LWGEGRGVCKKNEKNGRTFDLDTKRKNRYGLIKKGKTPLVLRKEREKLKVFWSIDAVTTRGAAERGGKGKGRYQMPYNSAGGEVRCLKQKKMAFLKSVFWENYD